jgi:transcription initiation factor TFIIF subunit alpha
LYEIGARYNFNKVAQYKQLTLEEAEEQMKNRRKTADGYQRWMMKAANTGPSVFADMEKLPGSAGGGGRGNHKKGGDDDENDVGSDVGEDDMDDEEARKNRLGMNKGSKGGDEDGEEPARDENDFDDEEPERGEDSSLNAWMPHITLLCKVEKKNEGLTYM